MDCHLVPQPTLAAQSILTRSPSNACSLSCYYHKNQPEPLSRPAQSPTTWEPDKAATDDILFMLQGIAEEEEKIRVKGKGKKRELELSEEGMKVCDLVEMFVGDERAVTCQEVCSPFYKIYRLMTCADSTLSFISLGQPSSTCTPFLHKVHHSIHLHGLI